MKVKFNTKDIRWLVIILVLAITVFAGVQAAHAASPTLISDNPGINFLDVTTDGTTLYLSGYDLPTGTRNIMTVPLSGGTAANLYPNLTYGVGGITVLGSYLYLIDANGDPDATAIFRAPKSGSGPVTKIYSGFATGQPIVDGADITTDGTKLYTADAVQGRVHSLNPDGSEITQIDGNRYGGFFYGEHYNAIAVGGGNLYVADAGSSSVGQTPGIYTHSASPSADPWTALFTGAPFITDTNSAGAAYGNGFVYVTNNNTIYGISAAGGTLYSFSDPSFTDLSGIDYNNGSLYFFDNTPTGGKIYQLDAATVVPEPVSSILFLTGGAVFAGRRFWKKRSA